MKIIFWNICGIENIDWRLIDKKLCDDNKPDFCLFFSNDGSYWIHYFSFESRKHESFFSKQHEY